MDSNVMHSDSLMDCPCEFLDMRAKTSDVMHGSIVLECRCRWLHSSRDRMVACRWQWILALCPRVHDWIPATESAMGSWPMQIK